MVKPLVLPAEIRYFITSLVNRICSTNTPGPSISTYSEHFSAVITLLYEVEKVLEKPEEYSVAFGAVSGSATQSVVLI